MIFFHCWFREPSFTTLTSLAALAQDHLRPDRGSQLRVNQASAWCPQLGPHMQIPGRRLGGCLPAVQFCMERHLDPGHAPTIQWALEVTLLTGDWVALLCRRGPVPKAEWIWHSLRTQYPPKYPFHVTYAQGWPQSTRWWRITQQDSVAPASEEDSE